jgi:hypothetical protein
LGRKPAKYSIDLDEDLDPEQEPEPTMVNSAEELNYNKKFSKKLLGVPLQEAERLVAKVGLCHRIVEEDGRKLCEDGNLDVRRINFIVKRGTVIDVSVG